MKAKNEGKKLIDVNIILSICLARKKNIEKEKIWEYHEDVYELLAKFSFAFHTNRQ